MRLAAAKPTRIGNGNLCKIAHFEPARIISFDVQFYTDGLQPLRLCSRKVGALLLSRSCANGNPDSKRTGVSRDIAVGRFDRFDLSARIGGYNRRLSAQKVRLQEKRREVNLPMRALHPTCRR